MIKLVIPIIGLSAIILSACSSNPTYLGFYYKNAVYKTGSFNEQTALANAPQFNTLQACHSWGRNLLTSNPNDGYECSTGCRYDDGFGAMICRDTTKMITNNPAGASYDK